MLYELLETVDAEKKGRLVKRCDEIAASLACHAAISEHAAGTRKMRRLIDVLTNLVATTAHMEDQ